MQGLDFSVVPPYWTLILEGLWWTVVLSTVSAALSIIAGVVFALLVLYGAAIVRYPLRLFMWMFMGTPLLLQLFLIYFGLVQIGIDIPAIWSGIIGLSLHFAVYNADIFRSGIVALDKGQTEAARSLGFSRWQTLFYIVVPQAVRSTLPAIGNMMIALLKESSIVSMIGIAELVHTAQLAISETYRPFEFYLTAAACYYSLNLILEAVLRRIERKVELSR
ncbi:MULTISPECIES: amino acid ABC transporter permease [Alphaproteobacteria]|uniref:Amino acid ABC transporter permease n=2 Tax=Alphaproteobacteria TaxID=28211 RepID=A0A512HIK6_9HYPH|nr:MULTISPECIES: amino acid ABC transporter permease [Alphaproteobacteria]GEO85283.1 amino acid ABC transporter permease [Ciceribacter naphthalenivorans]GLR20922.1 amino acid ABC transporter permease [Ciceribacter naphthalenivorans]GLT03778.1 amino acid ABC transporter permease [Sphingomonas psychrolutea]